jgi:Alcohol dehydrogenase GroES-like domain
MFTETLDRFASAAGLRHHAIDDCGNPLTYERMVVDTQNTDLIGHNSPILSARSRIPRRPQCEFRPDRTTFGSIPQPSHEPIHASLRPPSAWNVGQRVGVGWHGGHDNTCRECMRGDFKNWRNMKICGISYAGGYQQYMLAPVEALAAIPETLSDA